MIVDRELTLEDYKAILRRRVWVIVIPAVVLSISAYIVSLFLPSRYTSETVVLVEEPKVPEGIVKSVIGGDVNERLSTMQEQILSRTRLQQLVKEFDLDKEEKGPTALEEAVERLRNSITVSPVRPMAETRANGLPGFTVSVDARHAYLAQQICNEITSFFMQQNLLLRERRAEQTTQFLTKQLEESKSKLDEQDAKLAGFQRRYMGELPDEMQNNFSLLTGLTSQLDAASQALNRAQQDKIFVETMLSQQQASTKLPQAANDPDLLQKQLVQLQDQLASLRTRYTDQYPDVIKTKDDIAQVEKRIQERTAAQSTPAAKTPEMSATSPDTPQIQQLKAQLYQINMTIREKTAQQAQIQRDIANAQAKLQLSPAIAQQYKSLTRDYQTALTIYNDLLKKQSDSEMAADLERSQEGEQFRVLDPPSLPPKPSSPRRPLYAAGGFVSGLGLGLALAFTLELQDTTFRNERDVERILKLPTLAMIPFVEPTNESGRDLTGDIRKPAESAVSSVGS